jgi:hypothetical protein
MERKDYNFESAALRLREQNRRLEQDIRGHVVDMMDTFIPAEKTIVVLENGPSFQALDDDESSWTLDRLDRTTEEAIFTHYPSSDEDRRKLSDMSVEHTLDVLDQLVAGNFEAFTEAEYEESIAM